MIALSVAVADGTGKACDVPLIRWAVAQLVLAVLFVLNTTAMQVALHLFPIERVDEGETDEPDTASMRLLSASYSFGRMLNLVFVVLFFIQLAWVIRASSCHTTAPVMYRVAYVTLFIHGSFLGLLVLAWCCGMGILTVYVMLQPDAQFGYGPDAAPRLDPRTGTMMGWLGGSRVKVTSPAIVDALAVERYTEGMFDDPEDAQCVICLCEYEPHDELIRLATCVHHFHAPCIREWLTKSSRRCPLCNQPVEDSAASSSSSSSSSNLTASSVSSSSSGPSALLRPARRTSLP
ncbi:uncharacterized protein AMSG_01775 [Thecamonas trahens ATCC 50062]|uniref:RING-type domain-containing protein n=1 Tax=Thecamonas trahens ATCC 50062 TaxID=461836 RepID=A0A0L0DTY5_THETB|nr:hypothetical protein AMSG_01775 [Thecamonas trahens ATCC 50062]KNC55511.1 hypothetical protein AMSG_01775 [Thecamonas trahens ATCC 50062]|eukprot:XP_013761289.1 hypothetical protein AMSG_01775 [Thecamonas trahens ATCC 50062]